jgi:hypothetical protein
MSSGGVDDDGAKLRENSLRPIDGQSVNRPSTGARWKFEVAWLGIIGIAIYVGLRYPYATYYEALGSSPEEVGLDYVNLLARSSALLVIGLVLSAVVAFFPVVASFYFGYLGALLPWLRHHFEMEKLREGKNLPQGAGTRPTQSMLLSEIMGRAWKATRHFVPFIAVPIFFILLVLVLPQVASAEASSVRACETAGSIPGFDLKAETVHVYDSGDLVPQHLDRELRLLGSNSSTYVLFDCRLQQTLRIPIGSVVVIGGG